MADALDYHYGFSIYLLNFNEVPSPYLWIHGATAGNGEFINTLGLFRYRQLWDIITIIFFNMFFIIFKKKLINKNKFLFLCIFILSSPTLLQLISGPKFLLFPQIITATALLIVIEKKLKLQILYLLQFY